MYKYIFVDFDNTLCLHSDKTTSDAAYADDLTIHQRFIKGTHDFRTSKPNLTLKQYLEHQKEKGVKIYALGWVADTFSIKAKWKYIEKEFPNLFEEFIGVGMREYKLRMIKDFCKVHKIKKSEVLLIDDNSDTIIDFYKAKMPICHPSDISVKKGE